VPRTRDRSVATMARAKPVITLSESLLLIGESSDAQAVEEIAETMVAAMVTGFDEPFDADLAAEALAASRQTADRFLGSLRTDPWTVPPAPPRLNALAQTIARRGLDLPVFIKLTRSGQSVFWPAVMERAEQVIADPALRSRALTAAFDHFSTYLETLLAAAIDVFQDERDRTLRGARARRYEAINALVHGREVDGDAASATLGYDLHRWHTALALSEPAGDDATLDRLDALVARLAIALGARGTLTEPSSSHGLWVWLATDAPPGRASAGRIAELPLPGGVHVTVGLPAAGPAGFRQSHEESVAAQRFARVVGGDAPVTFYADVEIAVLLADDRSAARALVARELAGLASTGAHDVKLRQTVRAFLARGCSATAAARDLHVHTNTVRYRVEQAETVLRRPLQGQQLQLQLALMLVDALGPEVLPQAVDVAR
jgi:hypothetical protein